MFFAKFLPAILVIFGICFMTFSMAASLKVSDKVPTELRRKWRIISQLIFFFLGGYIAFLVIQLKELTFPVEYLIGFIFLGGSIFVFLVINLTQYTVSLIREQKQQVSQANQMLLQKNKELQDEIEMRIKTEDSLREAEAKYRAIFQNAVEGIYQSTFNGRLLNLNPAFANMLGYATPEEMTAAINDIGSQLYVNPNRRAALIQALEHGPVFDFEAEMYHKNGGSRWLSFHAHKAYDERTGNFYIEGIALDVTDRKKMAADLQYSEDQYRDLFENASDLIQIVAPNGRYLFVNKSWQKALEYTEAEALSMTVFDIIDTECGSSCENVFSQILIDGKADHIATTFVTRTGRKIMIEGSANCHYRDGVPDTVRCIFRDVTEQRSLEDRLLQSQKMEAIGRLTGGVAHDFNNLLTSILGYSEIVLLEIPNDHPIREKIGLIHEAGNRAASLTRQLLAFSRKQVLDMKVVNLNKTVLNLLKMLGRLIGENIHLEVNTAAELHPVAADAVQIEQVLMNLVVNAKDAMPNGGTLKIETSEILVGGNDPLVSEGMVPGKYISLVLADTGEGIPADILPQIFEPFFTTKDTGKGTGLGLATVYGIVEQHKGHISVFSEPGKGTTFKLLFPTVTGQVDEESDDAIVVKGGKESIMVVDDDADVRRLLYDTLTPLGYQLMDAANGEDALRMVNQLNQPVDLLITDIIMAGMNGLELAREMKIRLPAVKIILMSGYTNDVLSGQGEADPGMAFINKPLLPTRMALKVRKILDG